MILRGKYPVDDSSLENGIIVQSLKNQPCERQSNDDTTMNEASYIPVCEAFSFVWKERQTEQLEWGIIIKIFGILMKCMEAEAFIKIVSSGAGNIE